MSSTHGNAGSLTFYRNYASSQFHPATGTDPNPAQFTGLTGNVEAIQLDTQAQSMNVVGNVLGMPGLAGAILDQTSNDGTCSKPHMFEIGSGYQVNGCSWSPTPPSAPPLTT